MKTRLIMILLLGWVHCMLAQTMPDTLGNNDGWRVATAADAAYWHNVDEGDVIIFQGSSTANTIDSRQYENPITLNGGKKLHIWRGVYTRIMLMEGDGVIDNTSEGNPVTITNLGGQVVWGNNQVLHYRGFEIVGVEHVHVTGVYDPDKGTGHKDYLGMFGDMTKPDWIYKFGLMGDQKFLSFKMNNAHGLGFKVYHFTTAKVEGVACMHGYFAGFNIKNDVGETKPLVIDVQNCLSGWHEGEGFYLGYNGSADGIEVSENLIICRNNVAMFTGAEGIQVDFMSKGSIVENNFIYKTGCFYQVPFQGAQYQENGMQWSFTESGVTIKDNIIYSGNAGSILVGPRYKDPGVSRRGEAGDVYFTNNLLGPSRRGVGFMFQGDEEGIITQHLSGNVIDSITLIETNDAYPSEAVDGYINVGNRYDPLYLENNIFPVGRSLYEVGNGNGSNIVSVDGSVAKSAPLLLMHENFGFNPKEILNFRGVWLDGKYGSEVQVTGAITYHKGDMVYKVTKEHPTYFKCIAEHTTVKDPEKETTYWKKMTWNGKPEPIYTPLLKAESYYNYRGMGLELNPDYSNVDSIAPTITLKGDVHFVVGDYLHAPEVTVSDNSGTAYVVSWFPDEKPILSDDGRITTETKPFFHVKYAAIDEAGNRTDFDTIVVVNECTTELKKKARINFHQYGTVDLTSGSNYWTDFAETTEGLLNDDISVSSIKDAEGNDTGWELTIIDGTGDVVSKHYGVNKESGTYDIGEFPAAVNEHGLRLRQGIETECHLMFTGLNTEYVYDFYFAGYVKSDKGEVNISIIDSVSGSKVSANVVNATDMFTLGNIVPDSKGNITLIYKFKNALNQDWRAISSLSGVIIQEKTHIGYPGAVTCSAPESITVSSLQVDENNEPGVFVGLLMSDGTPDPVYSLVNKGDASMFYVHADSLFITAQTNYEIKDTFEITILASNVSGEVQQSFYVLVNDNENETATMEFERREVIRVVPVPAEDHVTIFFPYTDLDCSIRIVDGASKVLYSEEAKIELNKVELDISNLSSGMYYILINANNESVMKKLIVK